MKIAERLFLAAVLAFAGVFLALSLSAAVRVAHWGAGGELSAVQGSAGKARDVDPERLRELLDRGFLSDHEALYYKRGDEEAPGGEAEAPRRRP